jgi:adenylate kinase family enzyme
MKKTPVIGNRVCVIGYSCSGKSTLADSLAKSMNITAYHMDLVAHKTRSDWVLHTPEEILDRHQKIINSQQWIIEGNYQLCLEPRLEKADTVFFLKPNRFFCALRYLKRSLKNHPHRIGKLPGSSTEFQWWLLKHILFKQHKNHKQYQALLDKNTGINVIYLTSFRRIKKLCRLAKRKPYANTSPLP